MKHPSLKIVGKTVADLGSRGNGLMRPVHDVFIFPFTFPACAPAKLPLEPGRETPAELHLQNFKYLWLAFEGRNGSGGEQSVLELRADEVKELIGGHAGLLERIMAL